MNKRWMIFVFAGFFFATASFCTSVWAGQSKDRQVPSKKLQQSKKSVKASKASTNNEPPLVKRKQVINFGDDTITGELIPPDVIHIVGLNGRRVGERLIQLREQWKLMIQRGVSEL